MGDAFDLLKDRVETVGNSITVQEMQLEMAESELFGNKSSAKGQADKVMSDQ